VGLIVRAMVSLSILSPFSFLPVSLSVGEISNLTIRIKTDNCYLVNRPNDQAGAQNWRTPGNYVARLQSAWSDVYSDQDAFQMYSCNGQNGSMAIKTTQGIFDDPDFPRTIPKYGCVVLEVQDWIDGINHPEWGRERKQLFEPGGDPYVLQASYRFSINSTAVV